MSVQNFSFLARLEVAEEFVVVVGWWCWWWWSRPSLRFSCSQTEQFELGTIDKPLSVVLAIARGLYIYVFKG